MKTNLLNDLSNVVKKGISLACSWSQVGRMSGEGTIEHPLSTHSAPFGTRWKPAGEKGSTRVRKHVAIIFAVLVMSITNIGMAWGATYTWTFDNSGNNSDVNLENKTTELSAYTSSGKSMSYVGGSSCKIGKKTAYLAMGGASSQSSNALSTRYFILTAPSANGTISVTFAGTASGNELIRTDNGDYQVIAAATSTTKVSSLLSGLTAGTTKIYIAFTGKCYISSIAWTDADAPEALTTLYSSDYKSSMESGASISVSSSGMGEQTGGSGWVSAYSKYYKATSTNKEATITFSPALSLVSDGNDRGKIRIYYGSLGHSLNATVINDFKINGGSSIGTAYGVIEKEKVHVIEYTIPVGTSTLTTIYNKVAVSNGCLLHVEVLTHSAGGGCGSTAQAALTLSSSSGTICGTGTTTFTVSGGSGTGALSVSSSAPSKATASISGSTVTVTGVAAGSATITVTKACDATYAEKTATYSATVAAAPSAAAGVDKTTEPGTGVALAATAAADGCTGVWTIQSGPNTSTAQLSSTSSATATFTPTVAGTYTLRWTVTNTSTTCSAYDEMKVTAAICSISECGNATLTYAINASTDVTNTAANLISSATASNTTAMGINSTAALSTITIGSSDNAGKAAAATSTCYPTKPTMSSKIGMYNGSSYSSSNYLQFAFTVNSGYTFTPCDIQFTVQPVSNIGNFRWEVTDGTDVYGYGVATNVPKGSDGGASVLTGLTSTEEMEAGTYYIRLYPYYNGSNTFRISNDVILKGTTASAAPSCTAPSSVEISGEWRYFPGQTISLTATPTGGVGTPAYQWQKEVSADVWENISNGGNISGATSNNLQISSCGTGNTGKYRCVVSTGATCSTNSNPFSVKIFTLNGAYDDGEFSSNNITFTSGTTGTATVHLAAGRVYKFKVTDNFGMWFGNSGRILEPASSWTFPSNNSTNCVLLTGPEGDYTFTVDIDHVTYGTPEVVVSVAYPDVTHPSAGYAYFRNVDNWTNVGLYMWYEGGGSYTDWGSEPWVTRTTTICGNTYYYTPLIPSWYNRAIFREVGGSGQTGNIEYANLAAYSGKYNDKSDANWHEFTTYTISFNAGGGEGTMSSITGICPDADQVLPANTFEKTGYTFAGWKDASDNEYADEATIEDISDDITLTAQWEVAASLTAISADVLYQAADMANITFTGSDQYWAGLSTNNCFKTYGNGTNNSAKGKTISSTSVTDDISTKNFTSHAYIEGSDVTSGTADPTYGAIEFITPSTAGLLYVYTVDGSSSNLKLRKKGSSTFTALTGSSNYNAIAVDANSNYYIHGNASKRGLYGIQYVSTYAVTITPTNVTKATGDGTAIKGKAYTATFTANTGYALPDDATVTIGGVEQTKGTGYTWTISAGTATLTVPAAKVTGAISIAVSGVALPTHTVSYNGNGSTSGDAPTDATEYLEGADVTVLGKNTLVKTNNGFAGWNTATDGSGTWRVQGETFSMGAADVALYAQWVPTANLTVGTLYKAGEMKAKAIGSSTGYRPGYSSNGIFELLGVGTADDSDLKNTPMQYTTDGQTIDGTEFTHKLDFRGQGAGSPSGTTLPTARAIKFHVGESGTLHLWVRAGSKINIVKDGSSASAVGSSSERTHETVEVTAGTWYLYATGTSTSLYGMKLMTCTDPELAYGTTAVEKNVGDAAFTNTLTNPNSLSVSYSSSNTGAATVNPTSGMVTIEGAGSTTITATWAGNATYCAGTATYTLTVSSGCTPQSLVKTQLTSVNAGTTTGYNGGQYAGDPVIATFEDTKVDGGYKLKSNSKLFVTLKGGFVEGDKINIVVTQASDLTNVGKLLIFYDASTPKLLTTIDAASAGKYTYTLTAANITTLGSTTTIGVYRPSSGDNVSNPLVKSVEVEGCREWAVCTAPDAVEVGSVTGEGATFTITDALNTNNYEIYYSTSSTAPTAETSATISGISTKSRAVTGLTAETTYYYWVRSNCGGATKSSWVAGTPVSFTTSAAAATHNVTYNGNGKTGGSVPTDDNDYEEGDVVTVLGNTGSLVKTGETFLGWSTSSTASSGTFYPAGYKFYMPNAAVTLYAVWGSAGATCVTLTDFETGTHDKNSSGKPDSEGKYFYGYKGTKSAAYAVTITTLTTGTVGVNGGDNLQMAQNTRFNIYADNTTTSGTPATFSNITSISFKIKAVKNTKIPTIDVYVGSTKIKTVTGGSESSDTDGHEYDTSGFTTITVSSLSNLAGIVKFVNTSSGSSDYKALFDDIQICYGSGAASGFTVSFNMNGHGSAIADIENVPSGSKIGAPVPAPTAVDVEFGGWYREAGCTNAWNFGSSTISKDTTLYAKWTTCAPSISAHPAAATYTQGAAATALSVTASGEGLNYQWYTSEDGSADIQGSSAIPGATSASYTPSTSLLGTIYYFCVVSNTCGNAVSNKAAITVNDSKLAPTANWTIAEPKEGGKGFTFSIEVNKNDGTTNWDGELLASMLTLSDNAILDGASIVVNNTNKTISGTYGVKAGSSSPVTFYLLLPATATQSATRLDHDCTFTPCAGGGAGDSYNVPVRKDYEKDASNNYRWVTPGAGEITYAVSSSISSAKAASTVASVFDSIMSGDKQYVWVKTYEANTKTIRLYVETSGANVSVSALYKNTVYTAAADKDIVSSDAYTVSYDGSGTAENTGVKGTHYMDITFDSPLDANDIICIKFSSSKVKAYGAVLTTVGDGGDQTTGLTWSNDQASGDTIAKQEDAADFTITAVRNATALKSLGLISYTSSNTAIATIDGSTGLVHIADNIDFGSDKFKTTTITATLAASGCYKKAVITYILKVIKHVCPDAPGTITYVDRGCLGMDLTLEGYEEGATVQWYKDGEAIPSATGATYNAEDEGEYYAVSYKTCYITSTNSIKLERASATAEKIVDSWYVKNGRRTPDIALVQTTGATSFTVTSGVTPIENIGGCTFELKKDGIIYLHGQKDDGSAPSDMTPGDMTITITVSGCAGALSGLNITIHKQAETTKPSVAFVVDGTLRKDGGTATSVSEAKTSDRDLWKYLNNTFALTGCNVYWSVDSKELREYYSQFDAILITDDPNTQTNGTGGVPYVKAFGTMVDVRPILTMEAFVGRYSDGGWHVYNASPSSPNPRQVEMKLECKNHDIFKGLDPETSDNVRVTRDEYGNEYWHVIMVDTTVAPYHNTSKDYNALPALQGFDPHKFDRMLGVGTIAEETLQGGVERQEEPAARMMILGIQNEAMAALTNEGKLIIKNAIEYLLKTNMEDVNDCSNYFTGAEDDQWNNLANWTGDALPDFETRVRILKPVVVPDGCQAVVARVDIATSGASKHVTGECNGSVTINPTGALIVGGKIRRAEAPHFGVDNLEPTENDDLIVKASTTDPHNQGALIFDNTDGDTRAVVEMWNPSYWEVEGGKKKKYWSYVAVPIQEADIPNFFWYGFTYLYDETSGWIKKSDGTSLYPFQGIGASLQTGHMETFYGPLATTESQDITLTVTAGKGQGMNLIGNSWTAPIQIANFEEDDFGDAAAEVWVFNTGNKNDGTPGSGSSATPGQWNTIPINSARLPGYEGLKVIPAMQAFEVNTTSETTLHLDYDRLVRAGRENLNEPMRAPRRSAAKQLEGTLRVRVSGEVTHTDVYLLKDARFSDAFDNGWDGHYLFGDDRSASLYAVSETEGAMAFLAQPEIDGTILGFAPSRYGNDYTFTFYYLGEEEYYLNDIKLQKSTLISEEESYMFTFEEGDTNRFYISKTPFEAPSVATGTENTGDGVKARKVLVNDKLYIILNGRVYSAEGVMVK